MYVKVKPDDKTVIYHQMLHPDSQKALNDILDSKTIIQTADIFKKKHTGTPKMKPGRHPKIGYLDK